jgi:hypothetical protein
MGLEKVVFIFGLLSLLKKIEVGLLNHLAVCVTSRVPFLKTSECLNQSS